MKQRLLSFRMGGALVVALILCGGLMAQIGYDCLPMLDPDCATQVPLMVAQDMELGTVVVQSNQTEVCVTYILNEDALAAGWLFYEAHLARTIFWHGRTMGNRMGTRRPLQ